MRKKNKKPRCRKVALRLPDLDHAKNSVLSSLSSPNSRRNYRFAMEQFCAMSTEASSSKSSFFSATPQF